MYFMKVERHRMRHASVKSLKFSCSSEAISNILHENRRTFPILSQSVQNHGGATGKWRLLFLKLYP